MTVTFRPQRQPCSVDGCPDLALSRGLCNRHYQRLLRHGDPETVLPRPLFQRQTHCKRGHEFTPETTLEHGNGHRRCRICRQEYQKTYAREYREYLRERDR